MGISQLITVSTAVFFICHPFVAYCKNWTPGPGPWTSRTLNTVNKKGPLTPRGLSPHKMRIMNVEAFVESEMKKEE